MASRPHPEATSHGSPIDAGTAGASARREYSRRADRERARKQAAIDADEAWRRKVTTARPVTGRLQAALRSKPTMTPESQATTAWATGADGEERVGQVLAAAGVVALHDRRVPRSRANIDHIAVGPAGVFVIDAKKYTGRVEARDVGGWFRPDVRLYVRGRDRSKLIAGVKKQCDVVRAALGAVDAIPIAGVLCFVEAEWPGLVRLRRVQVGDVTCIWPKGLPDVVGVPGPLSTVDIERIARQLADALPPA